MKAVPNSSPPPDTRPLRPLPSQVIPSQVLFSGAREIHIAHGGETYRLAVTRQGKLILTK
jgi:hemin uptake protein HemP